MDISNNNQNNKSCESNIKNNHNGNIEKQQNTYNASNFVKDFYNLYANAVYPILKSYEAERKRKCKLAISLCLIVLIIAGCGIYKLNIAFKITGYESILINSGIIIFALILCNSIYNSIKKKFENKIKQIIMPILMKAFKFFKWTNEQTISNPELTLISIIKPSTGDYEIKTDDNFIGEYNDVPIKIMECSIDKWVETTNSDGESEKSKKNVFNGVIIKIKMNKPIKATTIITSKFNFDIETNCYEEIKLEDIEFNKKFNVYSKDQIESRYLITTSFMERLKNISVAFESIPYLCEFFGDSLYIAISTRKDLFDLADLFKQLDDIKQYNILLTQFVSILKLVDHFKLNQNTGL